MKVCDLKLGAKIATDRGLITLRYKAYRYARFALNRETSIRLSLGMPVQQRSDGLFVIGAEIV